MRCSSVQGSDDGDGNNISGKDSAVDGDGEESGVRWAEARKRARRQLGYSLT